MSLIGGLAVAVALGQATPGRPAQVDSTTPGTELSVYLLTFEPGELVWEQFGHNALWIRDRSTGRDWAYDYGRFSFGRTVADHLRFAGRFAIGDLLYSMGEGDVRAYLAAYQEAGRAIWSQELDLPPAARVELRDFLLRNIQPENRDYQYNYYLDNCSTRIRDAIDQVVNGQLRRWAESVKTPWTYRDHTRRTTQKSPVIYTALMLGLGQPTDHPLSAWEEMFLPISLRPFLDQVTITDPDGRVHPLVKEARQLVASTRFSVAATPANWTAWYLVLGGVLGLGLAGLGRMATRSSGWRLGFGAAAVGWTLVGGIGGLILAALWAFTPHRFSYWNENLLQLNAISLGLAVILPGALWRSRHRYRLALRLAGVVLAVSALGLVLKVLPAFYQANLDSIALILPIHLGLFLGLRASAEPI